MKGFCSQCQRFVVVHEINGQLYHLHKEHTKWFGALTTPVPAFINEQTYRAARFGQHYYDLIELPSGGHVPLPIALNIIGADIVKIPFDRQRTRGGLFFFCPECKTIQESAYHHGYVNPGYSFYRCRDHQHGRDEAEYNRSKEAELKALAEAGKFRSMKWIKAERGRFVR